MRVVFHGVAHDIGHFVITAVLELFHRVENAALHGLQAIAQMRHSALHDYVTGVIEKIIGIHATQILVLMHSTIVGVVTTCKIEFVHWGGVGSEKGKSLGKLYLSNPK